MALSTHDFWRLVQESQLWSAADYQKLQQRFVETKEVPPHADAAALAKWLIAQNALTRYQAKILLGGRPGPFVYGDYLLRERIAEGRLAGCFKAVHMATQHPVLLWFIKGALAQNVHAYAATANQVALAIQAVDPCLWQTHEIVDSGKYKFIVLDDLSGSTADDSLATRGRLDPAEACRVMR